MRASLTISCLLCLIGVQGLLGFRHFPGHNWGFKPTSLCQQQSSLYYSKSFKLDLEPHKQFPIASVTSIPDVYDTLELLSGLKGKCPYSENSLKSAMTGVYQFINDSEFDSKETERVVVPLAKLAMSENQVIAESSLASLGLIVPFVDDVSPEMAQHLCDGTVRKLYACILSGFNFVFDLCSGGSWIGA